MKTKGTIAIDFDGVIHKYSKGWHNGKIYDEPMDGAFEAIDIFIQQGYSVVIFSTRSPRQIKRWMDEQLDCYCPMQYVDWDTMIIPFWKKFWNSNYFVGITRRKIAALAYIDDRAVKFTDWESVLNNSSRSGGIDKITQINVQIK